MYRPRHLLLLAFALLLGCTSQSTPGNGTAGAGSSAGSGAEDRANHRPVVRAVTISPNPIVLSMPAVAFVDVHDQDNDSLTFRHQWFLNGRLLLGQTNSTLTSRLVRRGDKISVEVTPLDGKSEGQPVRSQEVMIGNTLPEVLGVVLEPAELHAGEKVQVQFQAKDADEDDIRYTIRWWRNNKLVVEGNQLSLDTSGYARGDRIVAQVTPADNAGAGKTVSSELAVIVNSPPKITSNPPAILDQGRYVYTVAASDPDGDPLSYSLEAAPVGMTIDKATGRLEWAVFSSTGGSNRVKVVVEDGQEGHAFQEFSLDFATPS